MPCTYAFKCINTETPKDGPGEAASRLSDVQGGLVQSNASVKADNCFDDDNVTGANGMMPFGLFHLIL